MPISHPLKARGGRDFDAGLFQTSCESLCKLLAFLEEKWLKVHYVIDTHTQGRPSPGSTICYIRGYWYTPFSTMC